MIHARKSIISRSVFCRNLCTHPPPPFISSLVDLRLIPPSKSYFSPFNEETGKRYGFADGTKAKDVIVKAC